MTWEPPIKGPERPDKEEARSRDVEAGARRGNGGAGSSLRILWTLMAQATMGKDKPKITEVKVACQER